MLGNESRGLSHWRLFTIVFRILWNYSGFNEINSVPPDCIDPFILDILSVFFGQFEFGSEFGFFQGREDLGYSICHIALADYFAFISDLSFLDLSWMKNYLICKSIAELLYLFLSASRFGIV